MTQKKKTTRRGTKRRTKRKTTRKKNTVRQSRRPHLYRTDGKIHSVIQRGGDDPVWAINHLVKDRVMGQGAFAHVWLAHDDSSQTKYAVKVSKRPYTLNEQLWDTEVDAMKDLSGINGVVKIDRDPFYDAKGRIYIVMEYIDGMDLFDRILAFHHMTPKHIMKIMRELTTTLSEIHDKGWAHCDLKPENVLLPTDEEQVCRIVDFGLSLKQGHNEMSSGGIRGTAEFMAPEMVMDPGQYDAKTADIFSLGSTFFVMMCRKYPWPERTSRPRDWIRPDRRFTEGKMAKCPNNFVGSDATLVSDLMSICMSMMEFIPQSRRSLVSILNSPHMGGTPFVKGTDLKVHDWVELVVSGMVIMPGRKGVITYLGDDTAGVYFTPKNSYDGLPERSLVPLSMLIHSTYTDNRFMKEALEDIGGLDTSVEASDDEDDSFLDESLAAEAAIYHRPPTSGICGRWGCR